MIVRTPESITPRDEALGDKRRRIIYVVVDGSVASFLSIFAGKFPMIALRRVREQQEQ